MSLADPASATHEATPLAFHPLVAGWFDATFKAPTDAQTAAWPAIRSGRDTLVAAPTGSGKTLAAFLIGIDQLIRRGQQQGLDPVTRIVYISPLKALGHDIERNLQAPLAAIRELAEERGVELPDIRVGLRTGDTKPSRRRTLVTRPPHILITTPESFYLMLTSQRARETLRQVETVIVDEIHALARDRRGSHLSLSLERLNHISRRRPQRVGLSATQRPIQELAAFLTGADEQGDARSCFTVDLGHQRDLDLAVETPPSDLEAVAPREQWDDVYNRLADLIVQHHTTLVFVNTRALAERVSHNLRDRLGEEGVASHHGSLSRERRLHVEQQLKDGRLKALVATASLELGIDIGSIDLVCQIGSPRSIAVFLQRIGRSGHALGLRPKGRLFPTTRDELVESAALMRAVRAGELDRIVQLVAPLDVLAQQIVAEAACEDWQLDDLFNLFRGATPFRSLTREAYLEIVDMLATGIGDGGGRAAPLIHFDRINNVIRGRRAARLTALQNGGTIPELGDFRVVAEPDETFVGSVNEDFAIESIAGDIFLLGNTSWQIRRVAQNTVRVIDAQGAPPTIPFWLGEAPGRTIELSQAVGRLRRDVADRLTDPALVDWLQAECNVADLGAHQVADYLRASHDGLRVMPSDHDVVFERFFDDSGGMQLVVHAPFGQRINRAWGLALRKRFCVRFDFELQAAANDDAILLSLGPQHAFPLEEAFRYVTPANALKSVEQSILYTPMFPTRWRWNLTRALAVPRLRGGKKVPPNIQRMRSDDLMAAVFPEQIGCQENVHGPLVPPDHPLIRQTLDDCLYEAMDVRGLEKVLQRIDDGAITLHARDTTEPSPLAHEILNGRPYTFLDDAPLEERRSRAVATRRALPESARDLGRLDPAAIERVVEEAWPQPRDAEEVHDALLALVAIDATVVANWKRWLEELQGHGRTARCEVDGRTLWFAAENVEVLRALFGADAVPNLALPSGVAIQVADREEARRLLLRGHTEVCGPTTPDELAARCGLTPKDVARGLMQLQVSGFILPGHFRAPNVEDVCDRRLLARIHRLTLDRLRREIEPVAVRDFMRFLIRWQHADPGHTLYGKTGLRRAIQRLQGFELPAAAWEGAVLPARVRGFRTQWLDELCLAGDVVWGRLSERNSDPDRRSAPATRATPVTLGLRGDFDLLLQAARWRNGGVDTEAEPPELAGAARSIDALLQESGALFFEQIVIRTRRLAADVEDGLRDLIAAGRVTSDGYEGLRAIASGWSSTGRRRWRHTRRAGRFAVGGPPGRWSILQPPAAGIDADEVAEAVAATLLDRYGVVFRDVVRRESFRLPWRDVLRALRRLEARGDVRGGRFVAGFAGEQFALPDAVNALRRARRDQDSGETLRLAAVDPLNLTGVITPDARVPAQPGRQLTLVNGWPPLPDPGAAEAAAS